VSDTLKNLEARDVKSTVIPGRQYKTLVWVNRYLPWLGRFFIKRQASNYRVTD